MNEQRKKGESRGPYFAATNSGKGFVSFFDSVFEKPTVRKRYIIKGGPGTGKSSFMRQVADYAINHGSRVEHYRCSSDPDSLDGILIDGQIALLDGTAPHSEDTKLPGTRDEILNLGAFWDGEALEASYDRIRLLDGKKREAYRKAYRFLSACMEVEEVNRSLLSTCIREEKMRRAVHRLCDGLPKGTEYSVETCLTDSIGMKGAVHFDSLEREATTLYQIEESFGSASFYLAFLAEEAKRKQCNIRVSYDPICPDRLRALLFCDFGICFVARESGNVSEKGERVNMKRFLDMNAFSHVRHELRANRKLKEALLASATDALQEAGDYHFALEQIYVSCMDFDAEAKYLTAFCEHTLQKQLS